MRVLMFGWEFPPHISGGLGSACEGMVNALTNRGTEIIFVLPRLLNGKTADQPKPRLGMRGADGMQLPGSIETHTHTDFRRSTETLWKKNLRIEAIDSILHPYLTPTSYDVLHEELTRQDVTHSDSFTTTDVQQGACGQRLHLKGGYGKDLMSEVFQYSLAAQMLAAKEDFDVIHAHDWIAYPAGILARKISGKPLIVHVHATEADRCGENNVGGEVARIEREGMLAADKVIAVSHFTKELIMRVYGVPEAKIEVVHNAVSKREARSRYAGSSLVKHEGKQVLFMGRVTFQKGPDYFVEAARLVLNVMPDVRFVMAGSGDMLRAMVARVARYRMGRRFTFTGFLKGDQVDRMYASSDLYVMPSVSEPFGIAPLEAMVYDVPVLMSKQSGVSEVVQNALKVDFWDVREMAAKICAALAYPALNSHMVKNCQNELKTIRWDRAAIKLNQIYEQVAKDAAEHGVAG